MKNPYEQLTLEFNTYSFLFWKSKKYIQLSYIKAINFTFTKQEFI